MGKWFRLAGALLAAFVFPMTATQGQSAPAASGSQSTTQASYSAALRELHQHLGRVYPNFRMKGIDWEAVGAELLPRAESVRSDEEFGLLCLQMVARLKDSHAALLPGKAAVPKPPLPEWDPGIACIIDDHDRPVVYFVEKNSAAARAGIRPGMTVVAVNGKSAEQAMADWMRLTSRYYGYSSERCLQYDAARMFLRQMQRGSVVKLSIEGTDGARRDFELPATYGMRYLPRLPVPIPGITDSANISWKKLGEGIGYIYVRRIRQDLPGKLDRAIHELTPMSGLILDVRGNGGGGFDDRALRNFMLNDGREPMRPRYTGPIALLIDEHCISAGEGWSSWFVAHKRAKLFGSATAGASARKEEYTLSNGLYKVRIPVKAYRGFLDRPIELRGLEPDIPVRCTAKDLAAGIDTVLETARRYLLSQLAGDSKPAETIHSQSTGP